MIFAKVSYSPDRVVVTAITEKDEIKPEEEKFKKIMEVELPFRRAKAKGVNRVLYMESDSLNDEKIVKTMVELVAKKVGMEFSILKKPPETLNWRTEADEINIMISRIKKHLTKDVIVVQEKGHNHIYVTDRIGRHLGLFSGDLVKARLIGQRLVKVGIRVELAERPFAHGYIAD